MAIISAAEAAQMNKCLEKIASTLGFDAGFSYKEIEDAIADLKVKAKAEDALSLTIKALNHSLKASRDRVNELEFRSNLDNEALELISRQLGFDSFGGFVVRRIEGLAPLQRLLGLNLDETDLKSIANWKRQKDLDLNGAYHEVLNDEIFNLKSCDEVVNTASSLYEVLQLIAKQLGFESFDGEEVGLRIEAFNDLAEEMLKAEEVNKMTAALRAENDIKARLIAVQAQYIEYLTQD
jgi:hypothetical protein